MTDITGTELAEEAETEVTEAADFLFQEKQSSGEELCSSAPL